MAQFGIDVQGVKSTIPGDLKLKALSTLRPIILNKGLSIVNQMVPPLFAEVANFENVCPSPTKIKKIINKRNNIVEQANEIAQFLSTIFAALTLASTILGTIITIIKVVKSAKTIVQAIASFIPISPGAIPGGIGTVGDALNSAVTKADGSPRIVPVKESIDGLLIPLGMVIAAIAALVGALSGLDKSIANCVTPVANPNPGSNGGGSQGGNNSPMGDVLRGPLLAVNIEDSGKNYANGVYTNVNLLGGDGNGAKADIIVQGNKVIRVTLTEGGQGYSKELFDPKKGFKNPNYLTVKKRRLGKIKFNADELLETVKLKKKIVKKLEKQTVIGEGLLLSVKEIGAPSDSGGKDQEKSNINIGKDGININDNSNEVGKVIKLKVSKKGGGYDNGIFENVALQGGFGKGIEASLTIENGRLKSAFTTKGGDNYKRNDILTIPSNIANSSLTGIGAQIGVEDIGTTGIIGNNGIIENDDSLETGKGNELEIVEEGQNYIDGNYKNIPLQGGNGTGLTADLVIEKGKITSSRVTKGGVEYKKNDKFSIPLNYITYQIPLSGISNQENSPSFLSGEGIGKGNGGGSLSTIQNALLSSAQVAEDFSPFSVQRLPQSFSSGGGEGAAFRIEFTGEKGNATLTKITVCEPGYGYSLGDTITITNFDIATAGGVTSEGVNFIGTGDLVLTITPNSLSPLIPTLNSRKNIGNGTGGSDVAIGTGNGVGALFNLKSITPISENSKILNNSTGLVTSTPLTNQEYISKEEKLLAVLQGGPLLIENSNGESIELPGLTILDPALTQIAKGAQEGAETINESSYKGFILDIETRQFSPTLIQRRGIAINPSGIVETTTEFSFATQEKVLIEDLKLIIDELDLRADYSGVNLGEQITSTDSEVSLPNQ